MTWNGLGPKWTRIEAGVYDPDQYSPSRNPAESTDLRSRKTISGNGVTNKCTLDEIEQVPTVCDLLEGLSKKLMPGVMPRIC